MKKGEIRISRGFTIVEVALVLAVAGLIFIMVFLAVPALRASERDTERREDIAFLLDSIKKYQTNNRGTLPADWGQFKADYLGENFYDPSGNDYVLQPKTDCSGGEDTLCVSEEDKLLESFKDYRMLIVVGAKCDGSNSIRSSNPRKVAVMYRLEGSGVFCQST